MKAATHLLDRLSSDGLLLLLCWCMLLLLRLLLWGLHCVGHEMRRGAGHGANVMCRGGLHGVQRERRRGIRERVFAPGNTELMRAVLWNRLENRNARQMRSTLLVNQSTSKIDLLTERLRDSP